MRTEPGPSLTLGQASTLDSGTGHTSSSPHPTPIGHLERLSLPGVSHHTHLRLCPLQQNSAASASQIF